MVIKSLKINNSEGLQAQSAALLVQVASRFSSNIWIEQGHKRVNAKSIMGVLSLRLRKGDAFAIAVSGEDEKDALDSLAKLIEKGEAIV